MRVTLARRTVVPQVTLAMSFAAGSIVDPVGRAGVHQTMVSLLTEGTTTRSAEDIAIAEETLGASLSAGAGAERSVVSMTALTANLEPSLELMADVVRNPAFAPDAVARVKQQRLAGIAQQFANPGGLAARAFDAAVYGENNPYAYASSGGSAEVVGAIDAAQLRAEHDKWIRPDLATITVVGDVTMAELTAALEQAFGDWRAPATAAPVNTVTAAAPAPASRLVVVDRPNSPSSFLTIGRLTPLSGWQPGLESLDLANEVLGGGFLSRLNQDLRCLLYTSPSPRD